MPQPNVQIIKKDGIPQSVILPYDDYLKLLEVKEDAYDIALIRKADELSIGQKRVSQAEIDAMLGIS